MRLMYVNPWGASFDGLSRACITQVFQKLSKSGDGLTITRDEFVSFCMTNPEVRSWVDYFDDSDEVDAMLAWAGPPEPTFEYDSDIETESQACYSVAVVHSCLELSNRSPTSAIALLPPPLPTRRRRLILPGLAWAWACAWRGRGHDARRFRPAPKRSCAECKASRSRCRWPATRRAGSRRPARCPCCTTHPPRCRRRCPPERRHSPIQGRGAGCGVRGAGLRGAECGARGAGCGARG